MIDIFSWLCNVNNVMLVASFVELIILRIHNETDIYFSCSRKLFCKMPNQKNKEQSLFKSLWKWTLGVSMWKWVLESELEGNTDNTGNLK